MINSTTTGLKTGVGSGSAAAGLAAGGAVSSIATLHVPQAAPALPKKRSSLVLFERASRKWWNPQFQSAILEKQFWKHWFPGLRLRFRYGLAFICIQSLLWLCFQLIFSPGAFPFQLGCIALAVCMLIVLGFTFSRHYLRFYLPTSFLVTFLLCVLSLLCFTLDKPIWSAAGALNASLQTVLLVYCVVPLPLYVCSMAGLSYSILFELICAQQPFPPVNPMPPLQLLLHFVAHLLGVHVFIISQVRERNTFIKVGESLLSRKDLDVENKLRESMISSMMPRKVAEQLMADDFRRPSSVDFGRHSSCSGPTNNSKHEPSSTAIVAHQSTPPPAPASGKPVFRPFTMKPMEDVSILFADIVGFTQMSAGCSAEQLVDLLNDLFGRFDNLCAKCGCEKISTLGDCYYCVSGCPEQRPDHAQCCVEMGLQMCTAIRQFDKDRQQDVNMRVGIHTGTVMCGIVGIHRFKFDVFSNDVTLANHMESSGKAGSVHISQTTCDHLHGTYLLDEAEPAENGLKTYFVIGRNYQPFNTGSVDLPAWCRFSNSAEQLRHIDSADIDSSTQALMLPNAVRGNNGLVPTSAISANNSPASFHQHNSTFRFGRPRTGSLRSQLLNAQTQRLLEEPRHSISHGELPNSTVYAKDDNHDFDDREYEADNANAGGMGGLFSPYSLELRPTQVLESVISFTRVDDRTDRRLADCLAQAERPFVQHAKALDPVSLRFRDPSRERHYRAHFANQASVVTLVDVIVACIATTLIGIAALLGAPNPLPWPLAGYFCLVVVMLLAASVALALWVWHCRGPIPCVSHWVARHMLALTLMLLPAGFVLLLGWPICKPILFLLALVTLYAHCNFSQLTHWVKSAQVILLGVLLMTAGYLTPLSCVCLRSNSNASASGLVDNATTAATFEQMGSTVASLPPLKEESRTRSDGCMSPHELALDVLLALVLVAFLNRQFELTFRLSFAGDEQARMDTQSTEVMKEQADWLLNNLLPSFVVARLRSDARYSENFDNVAVLFAAIVNWGEMYEESYQGGREFLRVLNEVIGDFDELLFRPQYNQVEKIKTIGACYMAAAGLNPDQRYAENIDPREHMKQLMEFAMSLQQKLNDFNNDLLNFAFVMKLGFNIGPVTAGVIGTTKLYYDIWGDTVNIASRMYSTGVVGRIQVPERVKVLLEDSYVFEFRDQIAVKGVEGLMPVYLVSGRRKVSEDMPPPPTAEKTSVAAATLGPN